jgi:hypothetical protein
VFVGPSTQDLATTQPRKAVALVGSPPTDGTGRAQAEARVQAIPVVVLDLPAQDVNKVLATDDH